MVKNEQSMSQQPPHDKDPLLFKNCSSAIGFPSHINNGASRNPIDSVARHNLASSMEHRSSGRKSLSESSIDPNLASGNVSLRKQFHQEEENNAVFKMQKSLEVDKYKEADDSSLSNNTSSQVDLRLCHHNLLWYLSLTVLCHVWALCMEVLILVRWLCICIFSLHVRIVHEGIR